MQRIFVSHSHHDNVWCIQFVDALTLEGFDVWFDKRGLYGGDEWIAMIETEIESRSIFLIVLTPESWSSVWVRREFHLALQRDKRILAVKYKAVDLSGFITTTQILDMTGQGARLAAQHVAATLRTITMAEEKSSTTQVAGTPPPALPLRPRTDGAYYYFGPDDLFPNSYCLLFDNDGKVQISNVRPPMPVFDSLEMFYAAWDKYQLDTDTWSITNGRLVFGQKSGPPSYIWDLMFRGTVSNTGSSLDLTISMFADGGVDEVHRTYGFVYLPIRIEFNPEL